MDFPAQPPILCKTIPEALLAAFDERPIACLQSEDYILVFKDEKSVREAKPNFILLATLDLRGVVITAQGSEYDFVSRFFAPNCGIDEDPVTGSSFTQLIPYWSERLGKEKLAAKQISKRGGEVRCVNVGERVKIAGKAVLFLTATIEIAL